MLRAKWLIIAIATSLMLESCGVKKVPFSCTISSPSQSSSHSEPLDIIVNIDGSSSMLGYVNNSNSRYVQTLKLLDETLSLKSSPPTFYRSANKISRSDFLKAQDPVFYNNTKPNQFGNISIPIQNFIIPPRPEANDTLLVIVTDLDQPDEDMGRLNQEIQKIYLNKDKSEYAVGIWAIKSEFSGTVYVQEKQGLRTFSFPNRESSEDLRPFYVILIGHYTDIEKYFDTLKTQGSGLIEGSEMSIFSPDNLVKDIAHLDKTIDKKPPEKQAIAKDLNLSNNIVRVEAQDQNSQLWQIPSNQQGEIKITDNVNLITSNNIVPLDSNSIDIVKNIQFFDKYFEELKKSESQDIINIEQWQIEPQKLSFLTTIQPDKFPESGMYLFTIDVVAKDLQEQPWWRDWSWTLGRDNAEDGSKTHGFLSFMRGLKTVTTNIMAENPPKIGYFCYVLQKD